MVLKTIIGTISEQLKFENQNKSGLEMAQVIKFVILKVSGPDRHPSIGTNACLYLYSELMKRNDSLSSKNSSTYLKKNFFFTYITTF